MNISTCLILLYLFSSCTSADLPQLPPPPPSVGVAEVTVGDVQPWDELTGRVEAVDTVEIRPRVTGHVEAIRFHDGHEVRAGDVLFVIDPRPYRAAHARAQAERARAEARHQLAQLEATRADTLRAASVISTAERDTSASALLQAQAELDAATAQLALTALDLEHTTVRAPLAGRVGRASVSRGDAVAAGPGAPPLATLVSVDPVHVYFEVDERIFQRLGARKDQPEVSIGFAHEEGHPHKGRIDFIDNALDPATGTVRVRAVLPNPGRQLSPGMYARVRLPGDTTPDAISIDDRAVLTDQDRKFVYALKTGDVAERRDVKLGPIVDGKRVVTSGLGAGDRVVVSGTQRVMPGATVKPQPVMRTARAEQAAPR